MPDSFQNPKQPATAQSFSASLLLWFPTPLYKPLGLPTKHRSLLRSWCSVARSLRVPLFTAVPLSHQVAELPAAHCSLPLQAGHSADGKRKLFAGWLAKCFPPSGA